jgi:hypothetical protein
MTELDNCPLCRACVHGNFDSGVCEQGHQPTIGICCEDYESLSNEVAMTC